LGVQYGVVDKGLQVVLAFFDDSVTTFFFPQGIVQDGLGSAFQAGPHFFAPGRLSLAFTDDPHLELRKKRET
jgi:hypothetical protein